MKTIAVLLLVVGCGSQVDTTETGGGDPACGAGADASYVGGAGGDGTGSGGGTDTGGASAGGGGGAAPTCELNPVACNALGPFIHWTCEEGAAPQDPACAPIDTETGGWCCPPTS